MTTAVHAKIDREILSATELHKWSDDLRKLLMGVHDDILVVTSELRIALPNMVDDHGNLIFTGAQGKINARRIIRPANHAASLTYDAAKSALSTWTTFQRVVLGELDKGQRPRGKTFHATQ